jgi:hypothetical protein
MKELSGARRVNPQCPRNERRLDRRGRLTHGLYYAFAVNSSPGRIPAAMARQASLAEWFRRELYLR